MLVSSGDTAHFANSVMQLDLASGASADIVRIQACNDEHIQIGKVMAELQENSTLQYAAVDVGGKLVRSDVIANIVGAQSLAQISGVYLANGTQHIDNHILTDHTVGPAKSVQNYRGIIGGRARCVFNGKAIVREGADGSDAEQSNHNLLLSETAEIDTKPELEIFADDVKCSHGATVGQLDKSALFYLRSRGLSKDEAAVLLTRAFTGHVLRQLPIDAVRNHVDQLIERKLDAMTETPAK
jgi:Fe-S cluster assembly protein SufD